MSGLKTHIIGLCGLASVGKDTVGQLLATHAGFRMVAFADALRWELQDAFHVEPVVFSRREFKERPMAELALTRCTDRGYIGAVLAHLAEAEPHVPANEQLVRQRSPRWTLQRWGTEYRRSEDAGYWTRKLRETIKSHLHAGERHFVATDVRFDNEAETIRALGGQIWQITRPGITTSTTSEGVHASANDGTSLRPDAVISNCHNIKHLQQLVLGEFWALDAGLDRVEVTIP